MNKIAHRQILRLLEIDGRWDEQAAEQLPEYMKALFINILNTTNKIEEELKLQKNKHAQLVKKLVSCIAPKDHTKEHMKSLF